MYSAEKAGNAVPDINIFGTVAFLNVIQNICDLGWELKNHTL